MNNDPNSIVSVEQFVKALIEQSPLNIKPLEHSIFISDLNDYMNYGYHTGWLEDIDIIDRDAPLLRKNAARIIHEFMRIELREPDTDDVSCANKLRDLYDCRVCTKHVMQVYAKGIMEGYYATDTLYLFGMNEPLYVADMDKIISRIFQSNKRLSTI